MPTAYLKLIVRKGSSYFGSGSHTAGFRVLQGSVVEKPIGTFDNGFTRGRYAELTPETETAQIEVWDFDFVTQEKRLTGLNGVFVLSKQAEDVLATRFKDGFQPLTEAGYDQDSLCKVRQD